MVILFFVLCKTTFINAIQYCWECNQKNSFCCIMYVNSIFCIWRNTIPKQSKKTITCLHTRDHEMWKVVLLSLFFTEIYCLCALILFIWYKWIHTYTLKTKLFEIMYVISQMWIICSRFFLNNLNVVECNLNIACLHYIFNKTRTITYIMSISLDMLPLYNIYKAGCSYYYCMKCLWK